MMKQKKKKENVVKGKGNGSQVGEGVDEKMALPIKIIIGILIGVVLILVLSILYQAGRQKALRANNTGFDKQEKNSNREDFSPDDLSIENPSDFSVNIEEGDSERVIGSGGAGASNNVDGNSDDSKINISIPDDVNSDFYKEETAKIEKELDKISSEYEPMEGMNDILKSWLPFPDND